MAKLTLEDIENRVRVFGWALEEEVRCKIIAGQLKQLMGVDSLIGNSMIEDATIQSKRQYLNLIQAIKYFTSDEVLLETDEKLLKTGECPVATRIL